MKSVEHTFSPGETVQAAIRKYNRYNMPAAIVEELTKEYKEINEKRVPRVGDKVKIPLYSFIGQEEPVKQNRTVKKVPIKRAPPGNLLAPPPIQPVIKKTKKGEVVNFPKSLKELDPKKVKFEDEETDTKTMMNRMERRRKARLAKEKLVLEQEKEKKDEPKEVEIPPLNELGPIEVEEDKKEKPKKKPVEKKKKVKEASKAKKESPKKVDRTEELKQRRDNRQKKDIDKAKLLNKINRNRRRR